MSPQDLVNCIREEIIKQNLIVYDELLARPPDQVSDDHWRSVVRAYSTMSEEQQVSLRMLAKQAMVDTVSNLLGVLDGTSLLQNYRDDFVLKYGSSGDKLNGDLQDFFLASLEDES